MSEGLCRDIKFQGLECSLFLPRQVEAERDLVFRVFIDECVYVGKKAQKVRPSQGNIKIREQIGLEYQKTDENKKRTVKRKI